MNEKEYVDDLITILNRGTCNTLVRTYSFSTILFIIQDFKIVLNKRKTRIFNRKLYFFQYESCSQTVEVALKLFTYKLFSMVSIRL